MNKVFTDIAGGEYVYWQSEDRKIIKRINELIKDMERNGNQGKGKPEPLKYELKGYWSRHITDEHRLIYSIDDANIYIVKCRGRYKSL